MKTVILAGGAATRLRPLTCNIPKAMVPVLNIPFMEWVIRYLKKHDVNEVIMAQGILPEPVQEYFQDGSRFGIVMNYVLEEEPMGTAGAIKNTQRYIDDTFLVLNGDIFQDFDITEIIRQHRKNKAKATIALIPVDDPTQYGLIETNDEGRVTRFLEKPEPDQITTNMINAGIYVLEPEIFDLIQPDTKVSIERETYPLMLEKGDRVFGHVCSGYWMDTGTPEKYLQLHRDLFSGKSVLYKMEQGKEVDTGQNCRISDGADIRGPVVIGNNCTIEKDVTITGPAVIGNGCIIQSDCAIEDSVLWHNTRLEAHAKIRCSVIANDCHIARGNLLHNSILGDNVIIPAACNPESGTKIWPGEVYQPEH